MTYKHTFKLLLTVLAITVSACGLASPGGPTEVKITLKDFQIESSRVEFKVGLPYRFVVTNNGENDHELMLMPPVDVSMNMTMEQMDGLALARIEHEDLPPGATKSFDFTFTEPSAQGALEFACHVAKHYQAGMELPITVK